MYYGWRGKIGLLYPATGVAAEQEFHTFQPEGVATCTNRVLLESITPKELETFADRAVEASILLAEAKPDIIVFACTTGSFIKGYGYDQELVKRIEKASGCKAITTSTAVIMALKALNSKRLIVTTPYTEDINEIERNFLEDNGFEVLSIKGLGYAASNEMPQITMDQIYRLNQEIHDARADTIFISCTGLGVIGGIPLYEGDSKLSVVTSNQASLWAALRTLSVNDDLGLGKLFKL